MITSILILAAENVITDAETNNVSIINVLEEFSPPTLPIIIPKLSILSVFKRDAEDVGNFDATYRLTIHENIIFERVLSQDFQGKNRLRHTLVLGGLPITQPGILDIVLIKDENVMNTYQIEIKAPLQPDILRP